MAIFTKARAKNISPQEAYRLMRQPGEYILLDVRTREEYAQAHIPGAKPIPVDELAGRASAELPDKQVPVYVYCHSGARAARAAGLLAGMGYTDVFHFGGIIDWPYEVAKG